MELTLLIVVALLVVATLALQLRRRRSTHMSSPSPAAAPERDDTPESAIEPSTDLLLAPDEVLVLPPADQHASAVVLS